MSNAVSQPKPPTVKDLLIEQLRGVTSPMPVDVLIDHLLKLHPSKAKNPRASMRANMNEQVGRLWVYTDPDHVLPMGVAMNGTRFRIPLSQLELDEGGFVMDYLRYYIHVSHDEPLEHRIQLQDAQRRALPTRKLVYVKTHQDGILGEYTDIQELLDVKQWLSDHARDHAAQAGDFLIFTVDNWDGCVVRLEFERAADAPHAEIAQRDQQLCDLLFDVLEHDKYDHISAHTVIPVVIARLPDKAGVAGAIAGHHWQLALRLDERMIYSGSYITYANADPLFLEPVGAGQTLSGKPFTPEQGAQTYRFSAQFKRSKRKPVVVEILGRETFFELDQALREAFEHDTWDHLGGFWLLIPRANGRFREVEIGACAPDPDYKLDGSASNMAVAGVGLAVGSRLKYVYDFGDWVEHVLVVEAID